MKIVQKICMRFVVYMLLSSHLTHDWPQRFLIYDIVQCIYIKYVNNIDIDVFIYGEHYIVVTQMILIFSASISICSLLGKLHKDLEFESSEVKWKSSCDWLECSPNLMHENLFILHSNISMARSAEFFNALYTL